jgi:uncharacterized protein
MQINWHRDSSPFAVNGVDGARVRVGQDWRERSFWVHAGALDDWRPRTLADLTSADLDVLLARGQEVILLGTGERLAFPPPALRAHVLARGIGLECMSNDAAARTYNVLLGEGRAVLAAFLV